MNIACSMCNDFRFVTIRTEARRFQEGHGSSSDVFPCPICGQAVFDADGKLYGKPSVRYGNPYMEREEDYWPWLARNAAKPAGWEKASPNNAEGGLIADLSIKYPRAKPEWVRAWVLGNRRLWADRDAQIPESDLTPEEREVVAAWKAEGHRIEDCLRWIEGRRYDAQKDPEFMNRCRIELAKWRLLSGHDKPAAEEEAPW